MVVVIVKLLDEVFDHVEYVVNVVVLVQMMVVLLLLLLHISTSQGA